MAAKAAAAAEEHGNESPSTPMASSKISIASTNSMSPSTLSPYTIYAENYKKLFKRLEARPPKDNKKPMALLVMSGAFNPPHMGHIYALEAAAAYCQNELNLEVAGGVLSLEHDTVVRNKLKTWKNEIITPRHRLHLCQELVRKYSWITVDRWEVTRRAALDYLSVLEHSRNTWRSVSSSNIDVKVFLICDCSDMIKASPIALHSAGFGAITSCRLEDYDRVEKTIATQVPSWSGIGYVAENTAMIPNEAVTLLSSSTSVRRLLITASNESINRKSKEQKPKLELLRKVLSESAIKYVMSENIGLKMQSKEPWSKEDYKWNHSEQMFMEQTLKIEDDKCQSEAEKDDVLTLRMVEYSRCDPKEVSKR